MHYRTISPRIICEKYIESGDNPLTDYKIHCSDGKARFILVCSYGHGKRYLDVFSRSWEHLPVVVGAEEKSGQALQAGTTGRDVRDGRESRGGNSICPY